MEPLLLIPIFLSFIFTLLFLPKWIAKCRKNELLWEDMNKIGHTKNVAASGGVIVVLSFIIGVLFYIAIRTFIFSVKINGINLYIFALLNVVLILAVIGLTDDLLGWKHGGLSAKFRLFLALLSAVPLVVINAGTSNVVLPFVGTMELGIVYPLIIIPLGIAGVATTYNFLAGFNGLEAGQGIIILSFLSLISYITGNPWLSVIGACMVASLIVFYFYNSYPAKVFPGDILTYSIGALIAGMAILGNFERIALFVFIPYFIEIVLKIRGKLKKQSFGIPKEDGSLELPYTKMYGLTHVSIFILKKLKKNVYEKDVVYFIFSFQIIICLLALIIFKEALFT